MSDDTPKVRGIAGTITTLTFDRDSYVTGLVLNARTLKDAVSAATTTQALAAIDPSKGWQQQIATG